MWQHSTALICPFKVLLGLSRIKLGFPRLEPVSPFFSVRARFSYSAPTINLQSTSKSCFTTRWAAFPNSCLFYLLAQTHSCPLQTWYLSPKNNVVNFQLWFSKSHHNGGGRPGRQDNQFSNWTKGKTFGPSLPQRCFGLSLTQRDVCAEFLFYSASLTNHLFFSWTILQL